MFDLQLNRDAIASNPLSLELIQKLNMACVSWRNTEKQYKKWVTVFLCAPTAIAAPFLSWTELGVYLMVMLIVYLSFMFFLPIHLNKLQKVSLTISGEQFAYPYDTQLLKQVNDIGSRETKTEEARLYLTELMALKRPINALDLAIFNYLNYEV